MPPRHGKSEFISHWTPTWFLRHWPHRKVMLGSYGADFASTWGRAVRNTLIQYHDELRVDLATDSKAAHDWNTAEGGGMVTGGVGGPFTGRGADLLIVDDAIKNAEEAASPVIREKQWEWWRQVAYTRLEPAASAIILMTRWNHDDLAGRIKADMAGGGEQWEILDLPAIATGPDVLGRMPGEALWPERYPADQLERIRLTIGLQPWSALYQQQPSPIKGGIFSRNWFGVVSRAACPTPANIKKVVRFWDLAATEDKAADYTVGVKMGITSQGVAFILDVRRMQASPAGVEQAIRQTAAIDGILCPIRMEQEGGASGKSLIHQYAKMLPGFDLRGIAPRGDKIARAMPLSAAAERGDVKVVQAEWNNEYLDELAQFPNGAHDDQVDATSGAYNFLNRTGPLNADAIKAMMD